MELLPLIPLLLGLLLHLPSSSVSFNLDVEQTTTFAGPPGSYFGYTVSYVENTQGNWLLVGAPKADSDLQRGVHQSGAVYQCDMDGRPGCNQIPFDTTGNAARVLNVRTWFRNMNKTVKSRPVKDGQMFGATLVANSERIVACAPLRMDAKSPAIRYLHGICYAMSSSLQPSSIRAMLPLGYFRKRQVYRNSTTHPDHLYRYAYGQLGFSAAISNTDGTIMLGTPGMNDWTGGSVFYEYSQLLYEPSIEKYPRNGLIGYNVGFGTFYGHQQSFIAAAPRDEKVLLFHDLTRTPDVVVSEQFGSYFGAALCVLDLDQDGSDELLVGAPLYRSRRYEEGRVHVYSSRVGTLSLSTTLSGSEAAGARFGSALTSLGDINGDQYPDMAVGAPYEEDGRGCIYIFNGAGQAVSGTGPFKNNGVYSQRLCARQLDDGLRGFGFSLHNISKSEMQVAVGAYSSAQVVVLQALPVVSLRTALRALGTNSKTIHHETANLEYQGRMRTALLIDVTVSNMRRNARPLQQGTVCLTVEADILKQDRELPVRCMLISLDATTGRPVDNAHLSQTKHGPITINQQVLFYAILNETIYDVMTDMVFRTTVTLCQRDRQTASLDMYAPNTQQLQIPFSRYCKTDDCITDLSLDVRPLKPYIILGDVREITYDVIIRNTVDRAYRTTINLTLDETLEFVRIRSDTKHVACTELVHVNDTKNSSIIECGIGHPLAENTTVTVSVYMRHVIPTSVDDALTPAHMAVSVRTDSRDVNIDNNHVDVDIPVRYESALSIYGKPFPDEVFVEMVEDNIASPDTSLRRFTHLYQLTNSGPGIYPSGTLSITIPAGIHNSKIHLQMDSMDDVSAESECVPSHTTSTAPSTCEDGDCEVYKCEHDQVAVDGSLIVAVELYVNVTQHKQFKVTTTLLTHSEHILNHDVSKVTTSISWALRPSALPPWLLAVSIVTGFILLAVLVAILADAGFFRRKTREEMQLLIAAIQVVENGRHYQQ